MNEKDTLEMDHFERAEVSKMEWLSFNDCITKIREYNVEKKTLLNKVNECLTIFSIVH
jgi:hypothetical protein